MDLDCGSITSVVSRISGRGQVRHGRVLCCFDKKSQVPIESTRLDDDNDNVFEEPAEVFDIQFLQ